ncbi:methylase-like protein [Leptotrombidium deliense]|uniref:Acetylserotonin O-methyltransferase n=1 Tax=Leptotrombidium deliense TaxID=299467 RepID=A0A443RUF6_9ACAR|nr:methylase-like protein [Leptotrombidium deliense]
MRALANINVFKLDHNQKWTTTPLATVIFTKLKNYASSWLDSYSLLSTLTDVVKTGRNHFEEHYGLPCYEWYKSKPKQLQTFNNAMSEIGNVIGSKLTEIYDFSQFKYIVDVGGGRGVFMSEMLKSAPNVTGIVFDQPHVVQAAQDNNEEIKEVRDRITFIGGNFMDNVPSGGDCYTIRNVLNDYSDNIALQILKNIANEMNGKSKLLIIESKPNTRFGSLFDLLLLSNLNGDLRGEDGFQKLLPKAGLQINKCIKSVGDNMDIIEVFKVE